MSHTWRLLEVLRSSSLQPVDQLHVAAQLLAWQRLSVAEVLPSPLRIEAFIAAPSADIRQVMAELSRVVKPPFGAAFDDQLVAWTHLAPNEVSKIAGFVAQIKSGFAEEAEHLWSASAGLGAAAGESVEVCEVAELTAAILDVGAGETVYCPFERGARAAQLMARRGAKVFIETPVRRSLQWIAATSILADVDGSIRLGDPIERPAYVDGGKLMSFDKGLLDGPFGVRYSDDVVLHDSFGRFPSEGSFLGEALQLRHVLAQCRGRIVAVVPLGFLFRGAGEYELRHELLSRGWLEAVIQLPPGLMATTAMPLALVVVDPRAVHDSVLFVDGDQPDLLESQRGRGPRVRLKGWHRLAEIIIERRESAFSRLVPNETCKNNRCDLSVRKYVLDERAQELHSLFAAHPHRQLKQVAEVLRAQSLRSEEGGEEEFLEVGVKDIHPDGLVAVPDKAVTLSGRSAERARRQVLQPGDILFAIKGTIGRVGLVPESCGPNWMAGQSFLIIRPSPVPDMATSAYLLRYLGSPLVQEYVQGLNRGAAVPLLKTSDIKELPVVLLEPEGREKALRVHQQIVEKWARIKELRREIDELARQPWQDSV